MGYDELKKDEMEGLDAGILSTTNQGFPVQGYVIQTVLELGSSFGNTGE